VRIFLDALARSLPGLAGALGAWVSVRLLGWAASFGIEILLFVAVYLAITVSLELALHRRAVPR
jgi:hypothetical protein